MAYIVYGRHFKNSTHKAEGRGSLAERGSYIDDSVRPSGYMNSHIELPKVYRSSRDIATQATLY